MIAFTHNRWKIENKIAKAFQISKGYFSVWLRYGIITKSNQHNGAKLKKQIRAPVSFNYWHQENEHAGTLVKSKFCSCWLYCHKSQAQYAPYVPLCDYQHPTIQVQISLLPKNENTTTW